MSPCVRILAVQTSLASEKDYPPRQVAYCHGEQAHVSGHTSDLLHISRVYSLHIISPAYPNG